MVDLSPIVLDPKEKDVLKKLGESIACAASDPINKTRALYWKNLNDLKSTKPMVWINEIPWHEMNFEDELTLLTNHPWARELETKLRRQLYQWKYMPGDMIISEHLECPLVIHSTEFGITEDVDIVRTDKDNEIYSRHYKIQIRNLNDLDKIRMPRLTHFSKATENHFEVMNDIFGGIIPVKKIGQSHIWFTPWDYLIRWWGIQEALMDLALRPEMVHAFVGRMVDAWMGELDQFVEGNYLSLDNNNTRIGSGGYGYVSDLPGDEFDSKTVKPHNMWGCSNAQIFSEVSPEMHWEFGLKHDLKWFNRWGLNYYGCCAPLDNKIHLLKKIPNLRKVSVSTWCNTEKIVDGIGSDYVLSRKPSPTIFALTAWDPIQAEKELRDFLDRAKNNCHVELIMKDISTVKYEPHRLWEWEKIARRLAEEYS